MPKIVIDARLYGLEHRGLGRYLVELINALVDQKSNFDFVLLINSANKSQPQNLPANFSLVPAPWRVYGLAEQFFLPRVLHKLKPDLVHFPHFTVPIFTRVPFVVTIHDLILHHWPSSRATTLPKWLYWFKMQVYYLVIKTAVKRARAIITPSQTVAQEIAKIYSGTSHKITAIPLAPSKLSKPIEINNLPVTFFLAVGAAYPHKNLERLLRAMLLVRQQLPAAKLIIVGRKDFFMDRLEKYSRQLKLDQVVHFWGEASEGELAFLYSKAAAYVMPSLDEGFGLGPIEALANQVPVVASDIPVLREILGEAAMFVDPLSEIDIAQGIIKIIDSNIRIGLLSAAPAVLSNYSWDSVAQRTLDIYQSILNK